MNNIRYAINETIRKPFIFFLVVVQVLVATMILINALGATFEVIDTTNRTKDIYKDKSVYQLDNATNVDKMIQVSSNDNIKNNYELYSSLKSSSQFSASSIISANIIIADFTDDEQFYSQGGEQNKYFIDPYENIKGKFSNIQGYYVDSEYAKEFPFQVMEGRTFEDENFNESDITPIILGENYKGIYEVGDEFRYFDYLSLKEKKLKVIGILERNTYIPDGTSVVDLEDTIIYPMSNITLDNATADKIHYWINGCKISTDNQEEAIEEIRDESSKLGLYDFKLVNCKDQINVILNELTKSLKSSILLSAIILIFVLFGIITVQLNSIKDREEEYGIHLLAGARKRDIALRCIYSTSIYVGIGMLLGVYFQYFRNVDVYGSYYDSRILFVLIGIFICMIALITFIPYRKIKNMQINNILRRLGE